MNQWTPALRRAARSFLQAFLAVIIAAPAFHALGSGTVDWGALKTVTVAAAGAGCVALVSFVYNLAEDTTGTQLIKKN